MSASFYPRPYGPYVLLELLGKGGMSEVELARQALGEADFVRLIVIKRIHAQHTGNEGFVRMFQDEARINAELQHENIAQVYEFGRVGQEYYLAMEYVGGMDLRSVQHHLAKIQEPFPLHIGLRVIHDILAALEYAHSRVDTYGRPMHIVHRDVNPRNVMLSNRGEVKLIDFGVAKADTKSEQTVGHAIKGKYAYMAPEQIDGNVPLDGRADLFAVGLMLHELITGRSPFAGMSEVQIIHKILSGQLPPLGDIPDHPEPELLHRIHQKSLKLNQDERFVTAGEMRRAVAKAAEPLGGLPQANVMSEFLRHLDPDEAAALTERLILYRNLDLIELTKGLPQQTNESLVQASEKSRFQGLHTQPTLVNKDQTQEHHSPLDLEPQRKLMQGAMVALVLGLVLIGAASYALWNLMQEDGTAPPSQPVPVDRASTTPKPEGGTASANSVPPAPLPPDIRDSNPEVVPEADPTPEATEVIEASPDLPPNSQDAAETSTKPPKEKSDSPESQDSPSGEASTDDETSEVSQPVSKDTTAESTTESPDGSSTSDDDQTEKNTTLLISVDALKNRQLEVWIDGASHGKYTRPMRKTVSAGTHTIELREPSTGAVQTQKVQTEVGGKPPIVRF